MFSNHKRWTSYKSPKARIRNGSTWPESYDTMSSNSTDIGKLMLPGFTKASTLLRARWIFLSSERFFGNRAKTSFVTTAAVSSCWFSCLRNLSYFADQNIIFHLNYVCLVTMVTRLGDNFVSSGNHCCGASILIKVSAPPRNCATLVQTFGHILLPVVC